MYKFVHSLSGSTNQLALSYYLYSFIVDVYICMQRLKHRLNRYNKIATRIVLYSGNDKPNKCIRGFHQCLLSLVEQFA